jgi:hypothetical protein
VLLIRNLDIHGTAVLSTRLFKIELQSGEACQWSYIVGNEVGSMFRDVRQSRVLNGPHSFHPGSSTNAMSFCHVGLKEERRLGAFSPDRTNKVFRAVN